MSVTLVAADVSDVWLWVSAHVDAGGEGVCVCVAVCADGKMVVIDVVQEARGNLSTLATRLRQDIKLLVEHPKYEDAVIHIAMDANPLAAVQQQQEALREFKQLSWVCNVAGMAEQAGVTANKRQRLEALKQPPTLLYRPATPEWLIHHLY